MANRGFKKIDKWLAMAISSVISSLRFEDSNINKSIK